MGKTAAAEKAKPADDNKAADNKRLDFDNIEVKRMLVEAKKSGLLHVDELNKHLKIDGITARADPATGKGATVAIGEEDARLGIRDEGKVEAL